jgi:uncharacterized protein YqhQ
MKGAQVLNLIVSLAVFILLYKAAPLLLVDRLKLIYPVLEGRFAYALADGVIRMAIFLTFLYAMSLMKDIRRVFEYHGAEHKVVFNFESGQDVTVENAQKFRLRVSRRNCWPGLRSCRWWWGSPTN